VFSADIEPFDLSTDARAKSRADFERWRVEKEFADEQQRLERENARHEAEERKAQLQRAEAVHRANPVRHYKPVPQAASLPLTIPESPRFSKRLRSRTGL
jgi:targeting protein for Xklp2